MMNTLPTSDTDVNLVDFFRVVMRWKKMIGIVVGIATTISIIFSLSLPKAYSTEATIFPAGGGGTGGGLAMAAAQLTGLGLLGGLVSGNTPSSQLMAILESRTLAERIIEKYDLTNEFYHLNRDEAAQQLKISETKKNKLMEDAVKIFFSKISFADNKKRGTLIVKGEFSTPEQAAKVVNGVITELAEYLHENALTDAKRNRLFIENQLEKNKAELLESGKSLAAFYADKKISNVVSTVDVDITADENAKRSSANQLQAVPEEHLEDRPIMPIAPQADVQANGIQNAFADTKSQAEALHKKSEELSTKLAEVKIVKDVPQQVYLQYLVLRRELIGQINSLLTQQYAMAKINEAKEDLTFQVIDWARVPVKKCKPNKRQIVVGCFIFSGFASIIAALFLEYLKRNGINLPQLVRQRLKIR